MKWLFNLLYFNFILMVFTGCQSQPTVRYADKLDGCLEPKDIELLNELVSRFENRLDKVYGETDAETYRRYLQDVAMITIPEEFFVYPDFKKDLELFQNSEFYRKTWVKTSSFNEDFLTEIPPVEGEEPKIYDPVVIDPTGVYVNCLSSIIQGETINGYMDVIQSGLDISPGLITQALHQSLSNEELEDDLTRLIIAINFHYQIGIGMTEEK